MKMFRFSLFLCFVSLSLVGEPPLERAPVIPEGLTLAAQNTYQTATKNRQWKLGPRYKISDFEHWYLYGDSKGHALVIYGPVLHEQAEWYWAIPLPNPQTISTHSNHNSGAWIAAPVAGCMVCCVAAWTCCLCC